MDPDCALLHCSWHRIRFDQRTYPMYWRGSIKAFAQFVHGIHKIHNVISIINLGIAFEGNPKYLWRYVCRKNIGII